MDFMYKGTFLEPFLLTLTRTSNASAKMSSENTEAVKYAKLEQEYKKLKEKHTRATCRIKAPALENRALAERLKDSRLEYEKASTKTQRLCQQIIRSVAYCQLS